MTTRIGFAFVNVDTSWNKFTKLEKKQIVEMADFIDYCFAFGNEKELVQMTKDAGKPMKGHAWFGRADSNGVSNIDKTYTEKQADWAISLCNKYDLEQWGCNAESGAWRGKVSLLGKKTVNPNAKTEIKRFSQRLQSGTDTESWYLGYVKPNYFYPGDSNGIITRDLVESFDGCSPMVYQSNKKDIELKLNDAEELWQGQQLNCFIGPGRISNGSVIGNADFWKEEAKIDHDTQMFGYPIKDITIYIGNEQKNNTNLDDPYWMIFNGHSKHPSWKSIIEEIKGNRPKISVANENNPVLAWWNSFPEWLKSINK